MLDSVRIPRLRLPRTALRPATALALLGVTAVVLWLAAVTLIVYSMLDSWAQPALLLALGAVLLLSLAALAAGSILIRLRRLTATAVAPDWIERDALTGLHQRRYFLERLSEEFACAQRYGIPFAVALFDIDGLRDINENRGEAGGDRALRALAAALQVGARAGDLAARLDGDGFVLLLQRAGVTVAATAAERIARGAARRLETDEAPSPAPFSLSFGVAAYQVEARSPEVLLRVAERNLHAMKREKRRQAWRP